MSKKQLVWSTEIKKVSELKTWKDNPRKITKEGLEKLKDRIKQRGFHSVIVIDKDNTILSGNQRKTALTQLGIKEVNVLVPNRNLTDDERIKIGLESNHNDGEWDLGALKSFSLDLLTDVGFDKMKLIEFWDKDVNVQSDNFDFEKEIKIADKNIEVKRGDIYKLGRHYLTCNDATDPNTVKKLMNGVKVDLVDVDLPFNIGLSYSDGVAGKKNKKDYGGHTNDSKTDEEYKTFVKKVVENSLSVTNPDSHIFFWCDENWVWLFQTVFKELNIKLKRLLTWIKNNSSPTPQTAFNKAMEFIVYGTLGSPYLSPNIKNANEIINPETTNGNELLDEVSNIILQKRLPSNQYLHPTQKDPQVHNKILKRCSKSGDVVLDLTAGSGSILSACEQLGRIAYMCDYEPVFCQVILNRYTKLTGLNPIKIYEEK